MTKKKSYKVEYQLAKAHEDMLIEEIAKLKAEITELNWENENLRIENRRLLKVTERYFEAGIQVAKIAEKLKAENIRLKARLSVFSKRGVFEDAV